MGECEMQFVVRDRGHYDGGQRFGAIFLTQAPGALHTSMSSGIKFGSPK
jgi:hypothetical protein